MPTRRLVIAILLCFLALGCADCPKHTSGFAILPKGATSKTVDVSYSLDNCAVLLQAYNPQLTNGTDLDFQLAPPGQCAKLIVTGKQNNSFLVGVVDCTTGNAIGALHDVYFDWTVFKNK